MTARLVKLQQAPDLVDRVYRALLDAISDGSITPGARLTQKDARRPARRLGQPVLQALRLLLKDAPRRRCAGPRRAGRAARRGVDRPGLRVRGALDALAARLAAHRRAAIDPRIIETGRRAARGRNIRAMVEADIAFHDAIYAASANPLIGRSAQLHWVHLRRVMGACCSSRVSAALWDEHAAIAAAIARGDGERAAHLIDQHGRRASANLLARLADVLHPPLRQGQP